MPASSILSTWTDSNQGAISTKAGPYGIEGYCVRRAYIRGSQVRLCFSSLT